MKILAIITPEQLAFLDEFRLRMSGLVDFMREEWGFERECREMKRRPA